MSEVDLLLSTLHSEGVQLWVHDGELRMRSVRTRVMPDRLTQIRRLKPEIIARLQVPTGLRGLPHADRTQELQVSYGQEALWFLYQLGAGAAYTLPYALKITGPLDITALEAAFGAVKQRHEVLRTRIEMSGDRPVQRIDPPGDARIVFEDIYAWPEPARAGRARSWLMSEAARMFRLESEHPVRMAVLKLSECEHLLMMNMHHIAADDWSIRLFENELAVCYDAFSSGSLPMLDALPAQYADYAMWQRQTVRGETLARHLAYWRQQLANRPVGAELPVDRRQPRQPRFTGKHFTLQIPAPLAADLTRLGRQRGATPFMVFLAAYHALISRWVGHPDVLIGAPTTVRTHPQTDPMIGYFVNMLVLRVREDGDPSFDALLERVKDTVLGAYEHRDLPFDRVVREFTQAGDLAPQPLFQTVLSYSGRTNRETLRLRDLTLEPLEIEQDVAQFDLSLSIAESVDGLDLRFDYDDELFERETIERLGARLQRVLETVVDNASCRLSQLPWHDEAERLGPPRGSDRATPLATGERLQTHLDYWTSTLRDAPGLLYLPCDRPRPAVQRGCGGVVKVDMSRELTMSLHRLAQRHGATLFMTLLTGWAVLMARLSGQNDVVIGTPVANYPRAELEPLIDLFANTLALRVKMDDNPSVSILLDRVRALTLDAWKHQDVPFDEVVKALAGQRSHAHNPVFQVMLALNNAPEAAVPGQPGLHLRTHRVPVEGSRLDLSLALVESGGRLHGSLEYASDLFGAASAHRMIEHWLILLEAMVDGDALSVMALPLFSPAERNEVLYQFNRSMPPRRDQNVQQQFERHAAATPEATAVIFGDQQVSYGELNRRANQLAHCLLALDLVHDDRVALCLPRGIDMVVAVIAVLKAGAAYVPMDPDYPGDRLRFMLEDSAPVALVTVAALRNSLQEYIGTSVPMLVLDDADYRTSVAAQPYDNPAFASGSAVDDALLAYVIYTSGSTGKPKGVMVEHAQLSRLFTSTQELFNFGPGDTWSLFHSIAFDFSVWELWGALVHGGRLVVVPGDCTRSPVDFYQLMCRERITVLNQTPGAFRQLIAAQAECPGEHALRYVIFGGEALELSILKPWLERNDPAATRLINMYGITETTVHATYRPIGPVDVSEAHRTTVGVPLPDLRVYILDAQGEPVPVGVIGEIHVAGAGVARGYLQRPELTAQRFLVDPFTKGETSRMYRSGDLGRWRADGQIEYLGRNDSQVKVRGFRIELGEIETRLSECAGVREAVVIDREDVPGDRRLVAYLVPCDGMHPTPTQLRTQLAAHLPDHMLPGAFVRLAVLPLTAHGKLDHRALPAPDATSFAFRDQTGTEYIAPRNPTEEMLTSIWQEVLGVAQVGIHDNFFALGGHSFAAVTVVARINVVFDIRLRLRLLYLYPTVAELTPSVLRCVLGIEESIEEDMSVDEGRNLPLVPWLTEDMPLPDTSQALDASSGTPGLLAAEGGLAVPRLKEGMSKGIFVMPLPGAPVMWWAPDPRMVIPTAEFHMSRSLRRTLRRFRAAGYEIRVDTAFSRVWQACATVARSGGNGKTWIVPELGRSFEEWHREGGAHSFELWDGHELIGGVFCVTLGRMISADSMFGLRTDASKIALASLVAFCLEHRVALVDVQLHTAHVASLGGREIPRAEFEAYLNVAQREPAIDHWHFEDAFWNRLLPEGHDAES